MTRRNIGVVSMSDNHWGIVKAYVTVLAEAIELVQPGQVRRVYCGAFAPRRLVKPPMR